MIDMKALGAQALADNRAYKRPMVAASGGVSTQQPVVTSGAPAAPSMMPAGGGTPPPRPPMFSLQPRMAPAGYTPGQGGGGMPPKNLLVGAGGVPMANPGNGMSPGMAAVAQALMQRNSPNQNMQGPNAQATLGNLGGDIFGLKAKQSAAQAAMQPPAPAPAPAATSAPQAPGDWARRFFGSGMGGQYGNGNGMAKLQGWAQNNPEAIQRYVDAGHVPQVAALQQRMNRR